MEVGAVWSAPGRDLTREPAAKQATLHAMCSTPGTASSITAPRRPGALASQAAWLPLPGLAGMSAAPARREAALMRRILSFRDFDWGLLAMVLLLCAVSVLEIYSATLHTKYVGSHFHTKQLYWIGGGLVAMFIFSKIDYHRLIDWFRGPTGSASCRWSRSRWYGHKALGARRWIKIGPMHLPALGVGEADPDPDGGALFRQPGRRDPDLAGDIKAFALVGIPMLLVLTQPDLGTSLTYTPILVVGLVSGRNQRSTGAHPGDGGRGAGVGRLAQRQSC